MSASPVKRRVLGALDPNACSSPKVGTDVKPLWSGKSPVKSPRTGAPRQTGAGPELSSRTSEREAEVRKRRSPSLGMPSRGEGLGEGEPAAKRPCLEDHVGEEVRDQSPPSSTSTARTTATTARLRSASPDSPSVFDTSAADNSQVTILTEPDATGPAPAPTTAALLPRPRARLTREQAREKAEILRLRLGLASYKVRTNQTDVPLDRLEARPIAASRTVSRAGSFSHPQSSSTSTATAATHPAPVSASFPGAPRTSTSSSSSSSRRQLPSAPVRRGSNSSSSSSGSVASTRGEQQQQQLQQGDRLARLPDLRRAPHSHHHHPPHAQHQRRQSEVVITAGRRGDVESSGVPPRPRTATERVMDGEEDFEGRGGAASGLLSLARS